MKPFCMNGCGQFVFIKNPTRQPKFRIFHCIKCGQEYHNIGMGINPLLQKIKKKSSDGGSIYKEPKK